MALESLSVTLKNLWNFTIGKAATEICSGSASGAANTTKTLTFGITVGKANQLFADTFQINASGTKVMALGGSQGDAIANAFGETITFTMIKALRIVNEGSVPIEIFGHATYDPAALVKASTDALILPAYTSLQLIAYSAVEGYDSWAIAANDVLNIKNLSGLVGAVVSVEVVGLE